MKKLLILFIMFGLFFVPYVETQAYTINSLDDVAYGSLTYREIFIDSKTILNPSLATLYTGTRLINDGIFEYTATTTLSNSHFWGLLGFINGLSGEKFYINFETKINQIPTNASNHFIRTAFGTATVTPSDTNVTYEGYLSFKNMSALITFSTNGTTNLYHQYRSSVNIDWTGIISYYKNIGYINLTSIFGSGNEPNKIVMDSLYNEYQNILNYIDGYNQGNLDGYAEGLADNTAYVQGYNVGYTDGLTEGQDMETGSSIIVLVLAIMAFALMLFGFTSKRRIFNLFASGLFIALGGILFEYPAFIIVTVGLVIVNVYYTFVSD